MFDTIQLLGAGVATVIDTVLVAALVERRNWRNAPLAVLLLAVGAWLWHAGLFTYLLLAGMSDSLAWPLQWLMLMAMAAGLLLMPSAMLHGAWRLARTGYDLSIPTERRYVLAYLPLLALLAVAGRLGTSPAGDFLRLIDSFVVPYILALAVANLAAATVFLRVRRRLHLPGARPFFFRFAVALIAVTALQLVAYLYAPAAWPAWQRPLALAAVLSPLAPALLFVYFVLRFNFMRLVLERTLVYGAVVAGMLIAHPVVVQDVSAVLSERFRVAVGVLEAVAAIAFVLVYQPLRQRTAEALRYLMGARVAEVRERARRLSVELSARAGQPVDELLPWFVGEVRESLGVDFVTGWVFDAEGRLLDRRGHPHHLSDRRAAELCAELRAAGTSLCTPTIASIAAAADCLALARASLLTAHGYGRATALVLVGNRSRNRELGEEEVNTAALLVEQFVVTLDHGLLQRERAAAERRASEGEKLAALGLLAGSIAHEVKNPLSAIKTIATVLAEDVGPVHPHAQDLHLILDEVNRLAETTSALLDLARPGEVGSGGSVARAIEGTLRLLRHLARQRGVTLEARVDQGLLSVRAGEHALREIFVNLLANSLDAVEPGGKVTVDCHRDNGRVITVVRDTGPGLSPEVRARLFEPFYTTKEGGTGLGLYAVGRRVRELAGEVTCDSMPGQGTAFTVTLPCDSP